MQSPATKAKETLWGCAYGGVVFVLLLLWVEGPEILVSADLLPGIFYFLIAPLIVAALLPGIFLPWQLLWAAAVVLQAWWMPVRYFRWVVLADLVLWGVLAVRALDFLGSL